MEKNRVNQNGVRKTRYGRRILRFIAFGIGGVVLAALFALVLGFVVQWLWNWLMPDIFALKQISYWQAFGLVFLCRLLFGGFGHRGPRHSHDRFARNSDKWKDYRHIWREKGERVTDDLMQNTEKNNSAND
jgi:high-affinity Fe2+/Pb2+ permease